MRATKLVSTGGLWLAMSIACDGSGGGGPLGSETSSATQVGDETEASRATDTEAAVSASVSTHAADTDAPDETDDDAESGSSSDGLDPPEIPDDAETQCEGGDGCFAWCGTQFIDGSCHRANATALDASAFGSRLCDPLVLAVDRGAAWPVEESDDDDVRCFLQVLRYGHVGVAELYFDDTATDRSGHLVVQGLGNGYARLEMRIDGAEPSCGETITLSAAAAHVRAERDLLFDECLDTNDDIDVVDCVLGPAATFYADHDWIYDVAFPWLTGACGVP
jgi:hypothetical protein